MQRLNSPSPVSPLAAVLTALVGVGTVVVMFFIGLTVGAVLLVVAALFAIWLKVRLWLAGRKSGGAAPSGYTVKVNRAADSDGDVFEGQYSVIGRDRGSDGGSDPGRNPNKHQ